MIQLFGGAPVPSVRFNAPKSAAVSRRFEAGRFMSDANDFPLRTGDINSEIQRYLRTLQDRGDFLGRNEPYFGGKYLQMARRNVVGDGIAIQCELKRVNGSPDNNRNAAVETAFREWCKAENASQDGKQSFVDLQNAFVQSFERHGEAVFALVPSSSPFGFALRHIPSHWLDASASSAASGGRVINGVEIDANGRPVAYHFRPERISPYSFESLSGFVLPASQVIHAFIVDEPGQTRGIAPIIRAMKQVFNLSRYEEAELAAARLAASISGFYTVKEGEALVETPLTQNNLSAGLQTEEERDGIALYDNLQPGTIRELPSNYDFKPFEGRRSVDTYPQFVKSQLARLAAALGVSLSVLTGDSSDSNWHSGRTDRQTTAETWREKQKILIEQFCKPVLRKFATEAVIRNLIPYPDLTAERIFSAMACRGRGWEYWDPGKESDADNFMIQHGLTTYADVLSDQGRNYADILERRAAEIELALQVMGPVIEKLRAAGVEPDIGQMIGVPTLNSQKVGQ